MNRRFTSGTPIVIRRAEFHGDEPAYHVGDHGTVIGHVRTMQGVDGRRAGVLLIVLWANPLSLGTRVGFVESPDAQPTGKAPLPAHRPFAWDALAAQASLRLAERNVEFWQQYYLPDVAPTVVL